MLASSASLLASLAARTAAAQRVPWAQPVEAERPFEELVRSGVDSALRRWERAADAHDAARMAALYAPAAVVYPTFGRPVHGRRAIGDGFAQVLGRIDRPRWTVVQLTASGEVAAVAAELTYQVAFPTGGAYERRDRVQLALRQGWNTGWLVELQSGGDLAPTIAWAAPPPARLAAGDSATVRVRVTDALGGGIPDVLVSFGVGRIAGTVAPAGVRTDAQGEASAVLVAGLETGTGELRATAAIEPNAPVLSALSVVAP